MSRTSFPGSQADFAEVPDVEDPDVEDPDEPVELVLDAAAGDDPDSFVAPPESPDELPESDEPVDSPEDDDSAEAFSDDDPEPARASLR